LDLPSGLKPAKTGEFKKQKNLVVMAGSLEPRKNHMQFLSAIEFLAKEGIRVKAKILGSAGWENENILAKIHDLQAKGIDVERVGNLSDEGMRKLVAEAQVLLQISEAEGFGLPIAEALALGTKVIVSNVRPLNEWKSSRVSIVEIGDVAQLKNSLRKILEKPEVNGKISPEEITWADWHNLLYRKKTAL
jgi:glycosyltransferase involved in cell wall biosynthesis